MIDFRDNNDKLYAKGLLSEADYRSRNRRQISYVGITAAGFIVIYSVSPIAGMFFSIAATAILEFISRGRMTTDGSEAIIVQDILVVYPELNAVKMTGERLIKDVDPDFIEGLVTLAKEFNVQYEVHYGYELN